MTDETNKTEWDYYAELDGITVDNIQLQVARAYKDRLFLGGIEVNPEDPEDEGHIIVLAFEKPDHIQSNEDLITMLAEEDLEEFMDDVLGEVTLGKPCDYNKIIERINQELEDDRQLGYAMRFAALTHFEEYRDPNVAHEIAIRPRKTERLLQSKSLKSRVENYTVKSEKQRVNDLELEHD